MAHQIHVADVNPQLQRRRRHHDREFSRFQPPLGVQPDLPGKAAVVRSDLAFAQALCQLMRNPLGQPPSVHEHQSRAMVPGQCGDPVVDLRPHLVRGDMAERLGRHIHAQLPCPAVSHVHDRADRLPVLCGTAGPHQQPGNRVDGFDRCAEPDALEVAAGKQVEPFQ